MAWSLPAFLGGGTMLMGTHDGAVDHRRGEHVVWYAPVEIIDREQPDDPPLPIKDRQPAKRLGTHDLGCVAGILVFKTRHHVPGHQVVDVQPPLSGPCKMLVQYGSLRLI
jgi:hypothetical protein